MVPAPKLLVAYLVALIVAFLSERLVPAWSGVLIAAVFLYLPFWLARRDADPAARWGLTLREWRRSLGVGLLWCALIFPPFVIGFSVLQQVVFQRAPAFDAVRLQRWDDALYAERAAGADGPSALVVRARRDDRLELQNRGASEARVRLEGAAVTRGVRAEAGARVDQRPGGAVQVTLPPGGVALVLRPAPVTLTVEAPDDLAVAAPGGDPLVAPGKPLALTPGLGWWLTFALWQLALIALSEELFFRGFLQTGLNALWTRRWRLLGADVGLAWPITSLLFAVGHLATTPHPARLLVFFPGLLMGWLRERTGGLLAPVVFHGLSNLLMELLVRLHAG